MKVADQVIGSVDVSDDGMLITTGQKFWTHLGVDDPMVQLEITERLIAHGLEVSFEVVVSRTPTRPREFMEFARPLAPVPLNLDAETLRALSIQQPWVECILTGGENIELRSYQIREIKPLLLYASRTLKSENFEGLDTPPGNLSCGALVGSVDGQPVEGEKAVLVWERKVRPSAAARWQWSPQRFKEAG